MKHMTLDIHNYPRMYAQAEALIERSTISARNKDFIARYRDACLLQQTCGKVRLIRVMGVLLLAANALAKDFDVATREDLQHLITTWMARTPPYSAETLSTYKAMLKRFYTWMSNPAEFNNHALPPPLVSWMTTHVPTKERKKLQRNELLTPPDIEQTITICRTLRDKAFLSVLWETGGRIAEIGNLQLRNVTPADVGYTLDLTGKTGQRTVLIVSSAPLLTQWLNNHPFKHDPDAPLWVHQMATTPRLLMYPALRKLLRDYFRQVGITKRIYPHLFRHSRATYCLATGLMNEAQSKAFFGWSPSSDQLSTYAHLLASDANAAILRENNLVPAKATHDDLRASKCYRCGELNASNNDYCTKCDAVLNLTKAYEHQQLHDAKENLLRSMFKVLVEKGLVDDAARAVHDAGLGDTLKRLALHVTGEQNIASNTPLPPSVTPVAPGVKQDARPRETNPVV
jgi:integrase/recombinase XerD